MTIENTIINNLVFSERYCRKVLPFIKEDYFTSNGCKVIFSIISEYFADYDALATPTVLTIETDKRDDLNEDTYKETQSIITELKDEESDFQWITDTTEKWCQERAIYLSLMVSIKIADGQDPKQDRGAIPSILSGALSVSFDSNIGHDYIADSSLRYDFYHQKEEKVPFDLEYFNRITKGGLSNKTLNVALAGTGVGKSLFMCHCASASLIRGLNVLYITLEMAEEKIAERIDANLLNVPIQQLQDLPKVMFENKVSKLQKKTQGNLIIKEYPTASAHVGHFKGLLNELSMKRSIKPDIVFIDYLNICASQRYKGSIVNSYTYVKAIAEELRGLAVEANVPIVTATQTTRAGFGSTDVDLTDTSESFGLPATADIMFALISTEELEGMNQIMVKQLKNRYNDPTMNRKFCIGIDRSRMRLYDIEDAQSGLVDSGKDEQDKQGEVDLVKKFNDKKTFANLKYD